MNADPLSGAWKNVKLKPYNFKSKGAVTSTGALHPCMQRHIDHWLGIHLTLPGASE